MNSYKKYGAAALLTATTVTMLSFGSLGFAQTVTPVTCSVGASTFEVGQPVVITAAGGNGSFTASGTNISNITVPGNQFAVTYTATGTYPVTVTSGGVTGTCNVVVVASTAAAGALMCSPAVQTVNTNQTASFNATGGNGSFTWSSPDLTISNATGSGFSASYASSGVKFLTVTSNGATARCAVNVLGNGTVVTPPVVTPTLPATGGGFGK